MTEDTRIKLNLALDFDLISKSLLSNNKTFVNEHIVSTGFRPIHYETNNQ
jgi:hypothetical protein